MLTGDVPTFGFLGSIVALGGLLLLLRSLRTALRRSGRFRLTCKLQRSASRASIKGLDGVLWELVPGKVPDRRRLAFLARGIPVVSYSAQGGREVADLSRGLGFKAHLKAPLRPAEVARVLRPAPRRATGASISSKERS